MKKIGKAKRGLVLKVLQEKCPKCGEGQVYQQASSLFYIPEMNEKCACCGYKFDREPGYFLGAMYISYAIAVLVGVIAFITVRFLFPQLPIVWTPLVVILPVILIAKKNYKLSRVIYMHLFPW